MPLGAFGTRGPLSREAVDAMATLEGGTATPAPVAQVGPLAVDAQGGVGPADDGSTWNAVWNAVKQGAGAVGGAIRDYGPTVASLAGAGIAAGSSGSAEAGYPYARVAQQRLADLRVRQDLAKLGPGAPLEKVVGVMMQHGRHQEALAMMQLGQQRRLAEMQQRAASLKQQTAREDKGFDQESKLRGEFIKDYARPTREALVNLEKVRSATATPAGDLSLIFSYMKMLDPTSVVREGEQATAANARGVPEQIRSLYNRLVTGEKLTPEQRANFKSEAENVFTSAYLPIYEAGEAEYRGFAERGGVRPDMVIPDVLSSYVPGGIPKGSTRVQDSQGNVYWRDPDGNVYVP